MKRLRPTVGSPPASWGFFVRGLSNWHELPGKSKGLILQAGGDSVAPCLFTRGLGAVDPVTQFVDSIRYLEAAVVEEFLWQWFT